MKSHVDFGTPELTAVKGAIRCFKDALQTNPKIVPKGRPWNDNERQQRIEHLDHVYSIYQGMQNGSNSVTVETVTICFDLCENDILATCAACHYSIYAIDNVEEIKIKAENAEEVKNALSNLLNTLKIIGIAKMTMDFEYE